MIIIKIIINTLYILAPRLCFFFENLTLYISNYDAITRTYINIKRFYFKITKNFSNYFVDSKAFQLYIILKWVRINDFEKQPIYMEIFAIIQGKDVNLFMELILA